MAQDLMHGKIHEIPVVRPLRILQIERHDLIALSDGLLIIRKPFRSQPLELVDQDQKPAEPHFVPAAHQQFRHLAQRRILRGLHHLSGLRHLDAQKLVAITVLPWCGLEESHQNLPLLLIVQRLHIVYDLPCSRHRLTTKREAVTSLSDIETRVTITSSQPSSRRLSCHPSCHQPSWRMACNACSDR